MAAKKELKPGVAFVLMLVMICCALINGSYRHWSERFDTAFVYSENVDQHIDLNKRTAHNLLTVAARHLDADSPLLSSLKSVVSEMNATDKELSYRVRVCDRFVQTAKPLLGLLAEYTSVKEDSRDLMYVSQMLPQAVAECEKRDAIESYEQYAIGFNEELGSTLSGIVADLIFVDKMEYATYDSNEIMEKVQ